MSAAFFILWNTGGAFYLKKLKYLSAVFIKAEQHTLGGGAHESLSGLCVIISLGINTTCHSLDFWIWIQLAFNLKCQQFKWQKVFSCWCEFVKDVDSYIHRSGRTGRAGRTGICICLFQRREEDLLKQVEHKAVSCTSDCCSRKLFSS